MASPASSSRSTISRSQAQFPEPYPMFVDVLAGFTTVGSGLALGGGGGGGGGGNVQGPYAPAHYLKQFHQKYATPDQLDAAVKAAGVDNWVSPDQVQERLPDQRRLSGADALADDHRRTIRPTGRSSGTRTSGRSTPTATSCPYIDKMVADSRGKSGGRQLAGHGRRADEQTRHLDLQKLPGLPREPREGQLHRSARSPGGVARRPSLQFNLLVRRLIPKSRSG